MASSQRQPRLWRPALSETLREAIRNSSLSVYRLAKASGVSPAVITRFLKGQRDLRLSTVEKLAEVLGLELVQTHPPDQQEETLSGKKGSVHHEEQQPAAQLPAPPLSADEPRRQQA